MDPSLERQYFIQRVADFVGALEEHGGEVHLTDDHRLLFRVSKRPFEALAWVDEDYDIICITTRTENFATSKFAEAVNILEKTLGICWEHCVAVSPVTISPEENRYDLSMALFIGGCTFEAFEGIIYNLIACAEAIEENVKGKRKK